MHRQQVENIIEAIIHILMWLYIFGSPLPFLWRDEHVDWLHFGVMSLFNLFIAFVFYINYFFFIPRFVLRVRKIRWFVVSNLLLLLVVQSGFELQHSDHFQKLKFIHFYLVKDLRFIVLKQIDGFKCFIKISAAALPPFNSKETTPQPPFGIYFCAMS